MIVDWFVFWTVLKQLVQVSTHQNTQFPIPLCVFVRKNNADDKNDNVNYEKFGSYGPSMANLKMLATESGQKKTQK